MFDAPTLLLPAIDLFSRSGKPIRKRDEPPTHLEWAENIARLIARWAGLGAQSSAADDLVQVAHLTLVRIAPRFDPSLVPPGGDPDGQFRGWAHLHIRGECQREAIRLRNGGAFETTNDADAKAMSVGGIPEGWAIACVPEPGEEGYPRVRRRWGDATGDEIHDCRPVAHRILTRRVSRRLCRLLAALERWPAPGRDVVDAIEGAVGAAVRGSVEEYAPCLSFAARPEFTADWFSQFDTVQAPPTDHRDETPLVTKLTRERRTERDERCARYAARWRDAIREHFERGTGI